MPDDQQTIRVGLIGYGFVGKNFHAPLIRSTQGLTLELVGSSRPEAVRADIPEARVCASEDVPTHPDVDLVVIASPNESHYPLAAAALRAGKDVVVDKPFTVTLEEARSLAAIAKSSGRLLSVFHNRRWESEVLGMKAVLASGVLGEVTHYECHMDRFRPVVRQRWRENPGPGAGLFFDLGPHMIDLAVHHFGLPDSISANLATLRAGGKTDDWAHAVLAYENLRIVLHCSLLAAGAAPRHTLHGTRGSWIKFGMDVQEQQLIAGMRPDDPSFGIDPDAGILVDGATGARTSTPVPRGNQRRYYEGIRDAILSAQAPQVSAQDAVVTMAILETCFESNRRGQSLPLPLTDIERAEWNDQSQ